MGKIIKCKITYSESEWNSNFVINSVSDFDSEFDSASDSESDSSLAVSLFYICIPLNKPANVFFYTFS